MLITLRLKIGTATLKYNFGDFAIYDESAEAGQVSTSCEIMVLRLELHVTGAKSQG